MTNLIMPDWRAVLCAALFTASALVSSTYGQTYPDRPITIIIPTGPGPTDSVARIVLERAAKSIGQPMAVLNRPGAGGLIGLEQLLTTPPDGYLIGAFPGNILSLQPIINKKYEDVMARVTPITLLAHAPFVLAVNPQKVPVKNLQEFAAYLKARPRQLNYGTPGIGTTFQFATEIALNSLGVEATHVPYKSEVSVATDVIGGQIDFMMATLSVAQRYVESGEMRALAVTTDQRIAQLPGVPTFKERGHDVSISGWMGVFGPPGLSTAIRDKLNAALLEALKDPSVAEGITKIGSPPVGTTPDELAAKVKLDQDLYRAVLQSQRIVLDQK